MKVIAFNYTEPICAALRADISKKVLTIENVYWWQSIELHKIINDLDRFKLKVLINDGCLIEKELRCFYKVIKINQNSNELAQDIYLSLVKEERYIEKNYLNLAIPYFWQCMVILLNGVNTDLSSNSIAGSCESNAYSVSESIIREINGYGGRENDPNSAFYIDRDRYTRPMW